MDGLGARRCQAPPALGAELCITAVASALLTMVCERRILGP
jgi:hypothetical protein